MLIPTTAEQLDTEVYNHTTSLLQGSNFFGHLQEGIRQRTLANYVTDVRL